MLQQITGVIMGSSLSPPLFNIVCMYYEHKALTALQPTHRAAVCGMRFMDDVALCFSRRERSETLSFVPFAGAAINDNSDVSDGTEKGMRLGGTSPSTT